MNFVLQVHARAVVATAASAQDMETRVGRLALENGYPSKPRGGFAYFRLYGPLATHFGQS